MRRIALDRFLAQAIRASEARSITDQLQLRVADAASPKSASRVREPKGPCAGRGLSCQHMELASEPCTWARYRNIFTIIGQSRMIRHSVNLCARRLNAHAGIIAGGAMNRRSMGRMPMLTGDRTAHRR
jgi:hypothetical protein